MSAHQALFKKGLTLEWIGLLWMAVEVAVALYAGLLAHSLALFAFGADSLIELAVGAVVVWRLYVEARGGEVERAERLASWVAGLSLLALAVYITASAGLDLWTHAGAKTSWAGLALAVASGILMPYLAGAKKEVARHIGSEALRADGSCNMVCGYMSWTLIAGLVLNALWGWWWLNALAGLALVYFVAQEGFESLEEARSSATD